MTWDTTGADHSENLSVGRRSLGALIAAAIAIALAAAMAFVHPPYVVFRPGPITDILAETPDGGPHIEVSGAKTYPTKGELNFTTVLIGGGPGHELNVWDVLAAWINPSADLLDEELVYPTGVTRSEAQERSQAYMSASQEAAIATALDSLGEEVTERVTIAGIADDVPAAKALEEGDEILAVDGTETPTVDEIQDAVTAHEPGETVELTVRRDGEEVEVGAETTDSDGGQAVLGIFLNVDFEFPYEVTIEAGDVGGPSAGMMFALAVRDVLTPGAMTGGEVIAGTGTISADGDVGPISGIRQKVVGAERGGADWFLAPAENCAALAGHVPDDLRVVRVDDYEDARTAVDAIASGETQDLPDCSG